MSNRYEDDDDDDDDNDQNYDSSYNARQIKRWR